MGDGRQSLSTSFGIPPFSFSCELEGPMASLLGTGVILLATPFLNAGFLTAIVGLGKQLTPLASDWGFQTPVDEFGVPLEAFEKKFRIEPFFDATLDDCFFSDGGTGVVSPFSCLAMIQM